MQNTKKINRHLSINVPSGVEIFFIGDVHEHSEQFFKMIDIIQPCSERWLVSVGDIYDKGFGFDEAEKVTECLRKLVSDGVGWVTQGNHELKVIRANRTKLTRGLEWWQEQPRVISFKFWNGNQVTALHAGVTPTMDLKSFQSDVEVCYVRDVDNFGMIPLVWTEKNGKKELVKSRIGGDSWHKVYNGRFGYIVSGHDAQDDGEAKYFNFSCNIDSCIYKTGILTCQPFDKDGNLAKKIVVSGDSKS